MASGSDPDARDVELASLSGEKLVDLLRTTCRRTDFEAAARVLRARDLRIAKVEAALSDMRKKYDALLDEHRRSPGQAEEMAPLFVAAALDPVHRDEPRVEELGDVPLSRPLKRPRQGETRVVESVKRIGQGQSKPVATCENSKQGRGIVAPEMLGGGGMPRTLPLLSPGLLHRSVLPKVSSQSGHGRAKFGKKEGSSDGVLAREVSELRRENGKIIQTSRVESSSTCASKKSGTAIMKECPSLCRQRQTEEWRIAKGGLPMEETRMAASPSLGIRSLSGAELRRYFHKPERTAPASSMEKRRQKFCDLTKRGNGLSKKLQGVSSKNKLLGGD